MAGERGADASKKLWVAYLDTSPGLSAGKLAAKLDQTEVQSEEIQEALERIQGNHTVTSTEHGIEITSDVDKTGRRLKLNNYNPKLEVHELMVVAAHGDKLPPEITGDPEKLKDITEPYGPKVGPFKAHIMRLLMIGTGLWSGGNYKALAQASQAGESSPALKSEGRVGGFLRKAGWATVYGVEPVSNNRYILTLDNKDQGVRKETWATLSPRFNLGTSSYMVVGRVLNVGRVRSEAPVA